MSETGMNRPTGIPLHYLAWAAALLPFITIHLSYLLAASHGQVEWCNPYWDSCTSISATGRQLPAKLWFKVSMIPAALVTLLLWWCVWDWRRQAAPTNFRKSLQFMPVLGSLAAVFLILYTGALGEEGDAYRQVRRSGVTMAFAFTYLSQLLLVRLLGELGAQHADAHLQAWYRRLLGLLIFLLGVGLLSVVLDLSLGEDYELVEDAFEWIMALLLNLYFAGLALALRPQQAWLGIIGREQRP